MGKDLIIGGASNYTWDQLKYWVNSIKRSGFDGDIVLVATDITKETIEKLVSEGVKLSVHGKQNENGDFVSHSNGAPHVERFFYIWNFLNEHGGNYEYVIATDTRDVVFQKNPSEWLNDNMLTGYKALVASSEGMKYRDEPWNATNLDQAFGPFFAREFADMDICNVGVIAGESKYVCDLFFMIFQMSINRPIPIVDQVVYNVLLQQQVMKEITEFTTNKHAWAAQLATTIEAVKSGAGDLGMMVQNNPSSMILYQSKYNDKQPSLTEDGLVVNADGVPFVIVHQYDRTKAWTDKITMRYA